MRKRLRKLKIIRRLADLRLTVACLLLLFALVFSGTLYQVNHGLYPAQKRFFESFFIPVFGFLPLPGGQTVLGLLFLNLLAGFFLQIKNLRNKPGLLISHIGVLLFFVSGFVTLHLCEETQLTLPEAEGSNLSSSGRRWEIAAWQETGGDKRSVIAVDADNLVPGQTIDLSEVGLSLTTESYFPNSHPPMGPSAPMMPLPASGEVEKNIPGATLRINGSPEKIQLWGGDASPTSVQAGGRAVQLILRRRRSVLPFVVKLIDFRKQVHPGTDIARSYESTVELQGKNFSRQTVISMNEPLRYKDFTFYQASFSVDPQGHELSTLAVVKNSGRILPYIATFVLVLGLGIHFAMMAARL